MSRSRALRTLTIALILLVCTSELQAQLFRKRSERRADSQNGRPHEASRYAANSNVSPYNPTGQPLTRLNSKWIEKKQQQDAKVAARTGQSVAEVGEKRMKRIQTFTAILGGAGAGLSGASTALDYSAPATIVPGRNSGLPSNFSQQAQWNAYNRSYSTNPSHAPVTE
jgi:hypothetical protein